MKDGLVSKSENNLVKVKAGQVTLEGNLTVPAGAEGVVLFAHGSGSSRLSPRNRYVAQEINNAGIGTLLFDLFTPQEEQQDEYNAELRFDIKLLAERLVGATDWIETQDETAGLNIGYFGSSTGAAAAIIAASQRPAHVRAIVSRGGRPDLAGSALSMIDVPTLLIVGGNDLQVIELNTKALSEIGGDKDLEIIPGATHLFEEPGALEQVSRLAARWFIWYLDYSSFEKGRVTE